MRPGVEDEHSRDGLMAAGDLASSVILAHVTKVTPERKPHLIFASVTAVLPTRRRLAILGHPSSGRSTLLQMLAGAEPPDGGRIITETKFSMLLNQKQFLHSAMNGVENVEGLARLYAMPPKRLAELAVCLPGLARGMWFQEIGGMLPKPRRSLEILVAGLLPFDCFLLDDIDRADPVVALTFMKLIGARGAGVIFTTQRIRTARQFGDCAAVIANRGLQVFESINDAERFYDG
jgi:capsular polysaccharide transport system ATP-binding protein